MSGLFASGHIVDLAFLCVVIEIGFVVVWRRGVAFGGFLVNLCSGISLMLALRLALVGAWWLWIAACLVASLVFHLVDLFRRSAAQP